MGYVAMNNSHNMPNDTHSFVVRIWNDASESNDAVGPVPSAWRGSIDHVGTGKRAHFNDLEHLIQFIQESSGLQLHFQPPPSGEPQRKT